MKNAVALLPLLAVGIAAPRPADGQMTFHYPPPAEGSVDVMRGIPYGGPDSLPLLTDVYRPTAATGPAPALVFFVASMGPGRDAPFVVGWARAAASNGLVGVYPDLRPGSERAQLAALLGHLRSNAGRYGIDPARVVLYAASANVSRALPLVQHRGSTDVAAAVLYYGAAEVDEFRPDLPLLFVRAGLDRPGVNESLDRMVATASSQNAPVWLLNHPAGYHGFEVRNDDAATRMIIDQTLDFARRVTEPGYRAALRAGVPEATAAGLAARGSFDGAARLYAALVRERPEDATLGLAYGEALLGAGRFAEACAQFDRLRTAPLGYRDRGIPAARACLGAGDEDAAIAWLESIPARFRPASLATDPAFEPLRDRPDFQALLPPR